MAVNFDGSTEYLAWNSGIGLTPSGVNQAAVTLYGWVRVADVTAGDGVIIANIDGADDGYQIRYDDVGAGTLEDESIRANATSAGSNNAAGSGASTVASDTWVCFLVEFGTSGGGYVDVYTDGTDSTSGEVITHTDLRGEPDLDIRIGQSNGGAASFGGDMAVLASWSDGMGASAIASLADGADPHFFITNGTTQYWACNMAIIFDAPPSENYSAVKNTGHPQFGTIDTVNGTPTGGVAFPHLIYSFHQDIGYVSAGAGGGGGGVPIKSYHYNHTLRT